MTPVADSLAIARALGQIFGLKLVEFTEDSAESETAKPERKPIGNRHERRVRWAKAKKAVKAAMKARNT